MEKEEDVPKQKDIPRKIHKDPPTEIENMTELFAFSTRLPARVQDAILTPLDLSVTFQNSYLELKLLTISNCLVSRKFTGEERSAAFKEEFQQVMKLPIRPSLNLLKTDLTDPELVLTFLKDFEINSVKKVEIQGYFGASAVNEFLPGINTDELVLEPETIGAQKKFDWTSLKPIQTSIRTTKLVSNADLDLEKFVDISLQHASFKPTELRQLILRWKKGEFPNFKNLNILNNKVPLVSSTIIKGIINTELVKDEHGRLVHCTIVDAPQNGRIANVYMSRNSFSFEVTDERDPYPEGWTPKK